MLIAIHPSSLRLYRKGVRDRGTSAVKVPRVDAKDACVKCVLGQGSFARVVAVSLKTATGNIDHSHRPQHRRGSVKSGMKPWHCSTANADLVFLVDWASFSSP